MSTNGHRSSSEIERDVEQTRARMAETLDELRARMSPGQILDEVLGYAKDTGGGRMINNLGRTLQDNPAPLLVIGAGIAWMMASSRPYPHGERAARGENGRDDGADGGFRTGASDWSGEGGPAWAVDAAETARAAGATVSEGISSAAIAAADTAADMRDAATRGMHDMRDAARRTGRSAYRSTRDLTGSAAEMLRDQPFVFGALGLALGAALGAALPETELEDELMGEASNAAREQAADAAVAGYEKAKAVAEETFDRASEEAEAQGLTAEKAEQTVNDLGERAHAVWDTARDTAREEASRRGLMPAGTERDHGEGGTPGPGTETRRGPTG